jgi:hypothetical protein
MALPQYAYTTSRMTFADPQFKKWETQEDDSDNLFIANFEGLTLVGGSEKKIYVFRRRPNPTANGYILDLAWYGIQERVWDYMSRREILTCYESPDQSNSFIIWAGYPVLLHHIPDGNQYVSREYKKTGVCKDMITIIMKHGKTFGLIKDSNQMVYCAEFRIKPWNKYYELINTTINVIHITRESDKHNTGTHIRVQYLIHTNDFVITRVSYSNPYTIQINIISMESTCLGYTHEHLELLQALIPNCHPLIICSTPESNIIGTYGGQYYVYEATATGINSWQKINTIDPIACANISPVNTSIWVGSTKYTMDNTITYYMYYYNQATHTLSKFRDTYHKIYTQDDDTLLTGFAVYNRIPQRILDELPFAGPNTSPSISTIIQKFIRTNVIIPQ